MTGKSNSLVETGDVLNQNLKKLDLLTKRFLTVVQNKKSLDPGLQGPGQDLAISAASLTGKIWLKIHIKFWNSK